MKLVRQQEWLQTRRQLLSQLKAQVALRLGKPSRALSRYALGLHRDYQKSWRHSSVSQLQHQLAQAELVLGADFHAYSQSQKCHVRLLRGLVKHRPIVLVLECLLQNQQKWLNALLQDKLSEEEFLLKVSWQETWGFPWSNYRPLIELAKQHQVPVIAAQPKMRRPSMSLDQVDRTVAQTIAHLYEVYPQHLIYVIFGDLHLAQDHLPNKIRTCIPRLQNMVVIHQDSEQLYFRLARRKCEEQVEILSHGQNTFCYMVSPPWMKWQSYLMHLEQTLDHDESDEQAEIDYTDHVLSVIKLLSKELRLKLNTHINTQGLAVYSPKSKASFIKISSELNQAERRLLKGWLVYDRSLYVPFSKCLYLSRPSLNHAAELAGLFIHAQLSQQKMMLWQFPQHLEVQIWIRAVAFFFSKWLNPKRKSQSFASLQAELAAANPHDKGRKALTIALEQRLNEILWLKTGRRRRLNVRSANKVQYLEAARILGNMLGEEMYRSIRQKPASLTELVTFLHFDLQDDDFIANYRKILLAYWTKR